MKAKLSWMVAALVFLLGATGFTQKKNAGPNQITLPAGVNEDMVRDAGNEAIKNLLQQFLGQGDVKLRSFAVLPMATDYDGTYFTDRVRDAFTQQGRPKGFELYTRMDNEWENILAEIGWGQQYSDTMDPSTVQKFGKFQGVQGLITGRLVSVTPDGDDVRVRFSLRAFEVETGRVLWGSEAVGMAKTGNWVSSDVQSGLKKHWWIPVVAILGLIVLGKILGAVGRAARPR